MALLQKTIGRAPKTAPELKHEPAPVATHLHAIVLIDFSSFQSRFLHKKETNTFLSLANWNKAAEKY